MSSYWGTEGHNIRVVTEELRYRKKSSYWGTNDELLVNDSSVTSDEVQRSSEEIMTNY